MFQKTTIYDIKENTFVTTAHQKWAKTSFFLRSFSFNISLLSFHLLSFLPSIFSSASHLFLYSFPLSFSCSILLPSKFSFLISFPYLTLTFSCTSFFPLPIIFFPSKLFSPSFPLFFSFHLPFILNFPSFYFLPLSAPSFFFPLFFPPSPFPFISSSSNSPPPPPTFHTLLFPSFFLLISDNKNLLSCAF